MGPRKSCIFLKSDALLDIGVLTREKKGKKGVKAARKKCINRDASLFIKNRPRNGGNGGASGACFRADSSRKIGAEMRLFLVGPV